MVNMWSYIISIESIDIYVFSEIKKLNKQRDHVYRALCTTPDRLSFL